MLPRTLRMKAVGPFDDVEFCFDSVGGDVVAIVGRNGAGKTMFVESMFASFYRYFPYRDAGIYRYCRGRDAKISFSFDQNGHDYMSVLNINAEKRSMKAFLYKDDKPVGGEDGNTGPFDEKVKELFGSSKMVLASSFGSQNKKGSFVELFKAERKALFISMLGLGHLQKISDAAGEHADASQLEVQRLAGQFEILQITCLKIVPDVALLQNRRDTLRTEVLHAEADFRSAESVYLTLKNKASILPTITQQMNQLAARLGKLQVAVAADKKALSDAELAAAGIPDLVILIQKAEEDLTITREMITSLAGKEASGATANHHLSSLNQRRKVLLESILWNENLGTQIKILAESAPMLREKSQGLEETKQKIQSLRGELGRLQQDLAAYHRMTNEYSQQMLLTGKSRADAEKVKAVNEIALGRARQDSLIIDAVPCHGEGDYAACQFLTNAIKGRDSIDEISGEIDNVVARTLAYDQQMKQLRRPDAQGQSTIEHEMGKTISAISGLDKKVAEMEKSRTALYAAEAAESKLSEADDTVNKLQMDLTLVNVDIETLVASVTAGEDAWKRRIGEEKNLKQSGDRLHSLTIKKVAAEMAEGQIGQVKERILAAEAELTSVSVTIEKTAQERQEIMEAESNAQRAKIAMGEAEAYRDSSRSRLEDAQEEVTRAEMTASEIVEARKKVAEMKPHLQKASWNHKNWGLLQKAFGKMEIQSLEIAAAGPAVSDIANKELLYSCFGPRFSIKFVTQRPTVTGGVTDDFDLYVYDAEKDREGSVDDLSGGERTIVSEAAALATALYNRQKSNVGWASIWRDEVSGALDDENAVRYITMLRRAREVGHFDKLFFIAHQSRVVDLADSQIRIEGGHITVT